MAQRSLDELERKVEALEEASAEVAASKQALAERKRAVIADARACMQQLHDDQARATQCEAAADEQARLMEAQLGAARGQVAALQKEKQLHPDQLPSKAPAKTPKKEAQPQPDHATADSPVEAPANASAAATEGGNGDVARGDRDHRRDDARGKREEGSRNERSRQHRRRERDDDRDRRRRSRSRSRDRDRRRRTSSRSRDRRDRRRRHSRRRRSRSRSESSSISRSESGRGRKERRNDSGKGEAKEERKPRKSLWDVSDGVAGAAGAAGAVGAADAANAASSDGGTFASAVCPHPTLETRPMRRLYVGNIADGAVMDHLVSELNKTMVQVTHAPHNLPGHHTSHMRPSSLSGAADQVSGRAGARVRAPRRRLRLR